MNRVFFMNPTGAIIAQLAPESNFAQVPNPLINLLVFVVGLGVGGFFSFLFSRFVKRWKWEPYPHVFAVVDALVAIAVAVIAAIFELWKFSTLKSLDASTIAGYGMIGGVIASSLGLKWIITVSKETTKGILKKYETDAAAAQSELTNKLREAELARDRVLTLEALACEAMKAKLERLSQAFAAQGTLVDALNPKGQILRLIQVLHIHVAKKLPVGSHLRIGIYLQDDDMKTLEPVYSWDGQARDVFSGKYKQYMDITARPQTRSTVVKAWLSTDGFEFVADCEESARQGAFVYFSNTQRGSLQSMVAYCYGMTGQGATQSDAFILTMDCNQKGFFASDVEKECRLLLPAFCRRIELELLASYLAETSQASSTPST
jgi:hypothetical protein